MNSKGADIRRGQIIDLEYEGKTFKVIVIDPHGLGRNQPSVGFGFGMMERYGGLPTSTADNWLQGLPNTETECLKLPSGGTYRVSRILGEDNNEYVVLEVSQWVSVAAEAIKKSKIQKATKDKLVDFLSWFAVKGFYADPTQFLRGLIQRQTAAPFPLGSKLVLLELLDEITTRSFFSSKGALSGTSTRIGQIMCTRASLAWIRIRW